MEVFMIIIMTVGEVMVHMGWDGDSIPYELLELMHWTNSCINLSNLAVRSVIESQHIALPEHVARRLGLLGEVSDRRREGVRKLRKSGHRIMPARCLSPTLVTSLHLRGGLPTYSIDPEERGCVDLHNDIPY